MLIFRKQQWIFIKGNTDLLSENVTSVTNYKLTVCFSSICYWLVSRIICLNMVSDFLVWHWMKFFLLSIFSISVVVTLRHWSTKILSDYASGSVNFHLKLSVRVLAVPCFSQSPFIFVSVSHYIFNLFFTFI